jgi:hypothetical protein
MFLGLTDLWRDPNRRMPHDRVVNTAVFRDTPKQAIAPIPAPAPDAQRPSS